MGKAFPSRAVPCWGRREEPHQDFLCPQTPFGIFWVGFGAPLSGKALIKGSLEGTESRRGPGGGAGLGAETLSHSRGVLERNSEPPRPLPGPLLWFDNHIFLFLKQMFFSLPWGRNRRARALRGKVPGGLQTLRDLGWDSDPERPLGGLWTWRDPRVPQTWRDPEGTSDPERPWGGSGHGETPGGLQTLRDPWGASDPERPQGGSRH